MKTIKNLRAPTGLRVLYMAPTVEEAVMGMARDIVGEYVGATCPAVSTVAKVLEEGVDYEVVEDEES
jgi:4-hydroxy-3-methylbut-2-enyl diphosphate reductase IspH